MPVFGEKIQLNYVIIIYIYKSEIIGSSHYSTTQNRSRRSGSAIYVNACTASIHKTVQALLVIDMLLVLLCGYFFQKSYYMIILCDNSSYTIILQNIYQIIQPDISRGMWYQ